MMSKRVQKYFPTLKAIARMNEKKKKQYLKTYDPELFRCFVECSQNVLKGNCKLSKLQLRKLRRYKKELRSLARSNNRTSAKSKQKILQRGGFLQALLVPAVATLGGLLMKGLFSGNKN